jgi:hypothetical protein|tara:strand:+ start:1454 stop:1813 length:360 start_codon:yes stop_codon:yes gene_type:complete
MAIKILDAATATGAGSSIFLSKPTSKHTLQADIVDANASLSVIVIEFQGSTDNRGVTDANAKWFNLDSHTFTAAEITALTAMWHVVNKPINRIRINVLTLTGVSAGDTVTVKYEQGTDS